MLFIVFWVLVGVVCLGGSMALWFAITHKDKSDINGAVALHILVWGILALVMAILIPQLETGRPITSLKNGEIYATFSKNQVGDYALLFLADEKEKELDKFKEADAKVYKIKPWRLRNRRGEQVSVSEVSPLFKVVVAEQYILEKKEIHKVYILIPQPYGLGVKY